jgi:hypothetical protein
MSQQFAPSGCRTELQQRRAERAPKRVQGGGLANTGRFHGALERLIEDMMTADNAGARIDRTRRLR